MCCSSRLSLPLSFVCVYLITIFAFLLTANYSPFQQLCTRHEVTRASSALAQLKRNRLAEATNNDRNRWLAQGEGFTGVKINVKPQVEEELALGKRFSKLETNNLRLYTAEDMLRICENSSMLFCPKLMKKLAPYEQAQCASKEPSKVVYLKTHKTASTSTAIIFYRYALRHDLRTLLPQKILGYYEQVQKPVPEPLDQLSFYPWDLGYFRKKLFSFFGFHAVWYGPFFRSIFGSDAKYFTILREPVSHFESKFMFSEFGLKYNISIHEYIKSLKAQDRPQSFYNILKTLLMELGSRFYLSESLSEFISRTEREFQLVMITEMYAESIILLGDQLCIPLTHLVLPQEERKRAPAERRTFSDKEVSILTDYYADSIKLYNHFKKLLQKKIDAFGQARMKALAAQYKQLSYYVDEKCKGATLGNYFKWPLYKSDTCRSMKIGISAYKRSLLAQEEWKWVQQGGES